MSTPVRQNDRLPVFRAKAFTESGPVKFLTDFPSGVTFKMVGPAIVTGNAVGDDNGNLAYAFAAGDTAVPGEYEACFVATDSSARKQTFPQGTNIKITIVPAL